MESGAAAAAEPLWQGEGGLALPLIIAAASLAGGAWLLCDLPATLKELRTHIAQWAAIHEVARRVDCKPWGFDKAYVITQDGATTTPSDDPLCSWAAISGRRYQYGLCLWNGAVALARLLVEQREDLNQSGFSSGRTVLEL